MTIMMTIMMAIMMAIISEKKMTTLATIAIHSKIIDRSVMKCF
jgi:hypothetical protein